jgi:hypothetical protein
LLQLYHSTDGTNWKYNDGWNITNTPCNWYGITCKNNSVTEIVFDFLGNITGNIPDFRSLPNLQMLSLRNNQLTGAIPNFSGLPNLQTLNLWFNQLMGPIPDFTNLSNLQRLYLGNNQLTGPIPDFSGLPNLQALYLEKNQLTGSIPDFSGLPSLQTLRLHNNQLTTVQIVLEKKSYHPGEYFKVELKETFSEDYDLYTAVLLPNGTDFMTLENTNQLTPLNQPQKWSASRMQNEEPITLLDFTLPADLATGEYCFYGILSPENKPVLEVAEQWVMKQQCIEVKSAN